MPQPQNKGFFSRLFSRLRPKRRYGNWVEEYNTEAAPARDDLMDLNNTRR